MRRRRPPRCRRLRATSRLAVRATRATGLLFARGTWSYCSLRYAGTQRCCSPQRVGTRSREHLLNWDSRDAARPFTRVDGWLELVEKREARNLEDSLLRRCHDVGGSWCGGWQHDWQRLEDADPGKQPADDKVRMHAHKIFVKLSV